MTDPSITATKDELKTLIMSARAGRKDGLTEAHVRVYASYVDGHPQSLEPDEVQRIISRVEAAIKAMRRQSTCTSTPGT